MGHGDPPRGVANHDQGANSVRIPLRWWGEWKPGVNSLNMDDPGNVDRAHLLALDKTIRWASREHLWIDLFIDSNNGQGANGTTNNFWTNERKRQQFFRLWRFIAERYKHTPYMGMLELLPEPRAQGVSDEQVREFYDEAIRNVRTVDRRTPLIVGPNAGYMASHLDAAHTTVGSKIIYTANYFISKPLKQLGYLQDFETKYDAPVWVNQVGIESGNEDAADKTRTTLGALNDAKIGWSWWTYRVQSKTPNTHGIYYQSSNPDPHWILKADWLALVTGYL